LLSSIREKASPVLYQGKSFSCPLSGKKLLPSSIRDKASAVIYQEESFCCHPERSEGSRRTQFTTTFGAFLPPVHPPLPLPLLAHPPYPVILTRGEEFLLLFLPFASIPTPDLL
jgi:hypothetical protein